jgi:hypothetical protein
MRAIIVDPAASSPPWCGWLRRRALVDTGRLAAGALRWHALNQIRTSHGHPPEPGRVILRVAVGPVDVQHERCG